MSIVKHSLAQLNHLHATLNLVAIAKPSIRLRRVTRLIAILLLLYASGTSVRSERLPIRIYTSADGLGSSFINHLMRDSRGFLWICTRDGLTRFDGSRFVTYQVGDSAGVEQILETRQGIYWIVTTVGLFKFDPSDNAIPTNADRPKLNVKFLTSDRSFLLEDRGGTLWSGSDRLYRLKEENGKLTSHALELNLPPNRDTGFSIFRMMESRDRSLWLLTSWGLVRLLPDGSRVFYSIDNSLGNFLTSILEDSQGRIWVGTIGSVYVLSPESTAVLGQTNKTVNLDRVAQTPIGAPNKNISRLQLPTKPGEVFKYQSGRGVALEVVSCIYQTTDGHVWISGESSLVEVTDEEIKSYQGSQVRHRALSMVEDAGRNLWLGSANGLARLNREGLTSYVMEDGLAADSVVTVSETRDNQLLVIGPEFHLNVLVGNKFVSTRPSLPPQTPEVWTANTVFQDSAGEWWCLTGTKLYRFAATKDIRTLATQQPLAVYDERDGLAGSSMFHMFEDSHRDLWISTREKSAITRWNRKTETFQNFTQLDGFPPGKIVSAMAEDKSGNMWFGFYAGGGLLRYAEGRFTEFKTENGGPDGLITALYRDESGKLWIASSQQGVSYISNPTASQPQFVTLTRDHGLASNNVRAITSDLSGNIYLGTASGVDRLSPDGTRVKHYSVNDGLPGDFVTSAFRDSMGTLWFGTPAGVSRLTPTQSDKRTAPAVLISGLSIAGQPRPVPVLGSKDVALAEISHSQNNLQIDFFGIDFGPGKTLRYQHKLEGADENWSPPTEQRSITFANLQPGTYRFQVRAIGSDGMPSAHLAEVSFRILAPIWLRWWFITLSVLLLMSILFVSYRYRVAHLEQVAEALRQANLAEEKLRKANEERLRELERVRKRIATDLHDDIGSSLTRISLLSEVAQRQSIGQAPQPDGPLTVVAGLSRELVDSMSDIVWAINPERDSLGDLTQRMRHFASDVFSAKDIEFQFVLPDSERELKLGANLRRELFLIFKEGVNNAVRHSGCTEARVELHVDGTTLSLKLIDNGHGFDVGEKSNGHGLSSMRARTEGLGGQIEISGAQGTGTTLSCAIPLAQSEAT